MCSSDLCCAPLSQYQTLSPSGLSHLEFYELEHTFASTAIESGQGLPMIGKLLGHTQVQTTARYAHLAADPIKTAADQVAGNIAAAMNEAA